MKQRAMAASAALLLLAAGILSCSGGSGTSPAPQLNCFTDPVFPLPANFSATGYWNNNLDLQNAFQTFDSVQLASHYCANGAAEGRSFGDSPVYSSLALSSEAGSSAGVSSETSSSSSLQAFSSAAPGTLPAEFDAREYCFLNSDLAAYFGVSDCAGLNDAQRAQFADHYVNNGAAEGRWWNVLVQCTQHLAYEAQLPCASDTLAVLRNDNSAEGQSRLAVCMADVPALSANLPCDFSATKYIAACKAAGNKLCIASSYRDSDYLTASWFLDGRESGWTYSGVPTDFSASGYCSRNADVAAIYGSDCDGQTAKWHYALFGKAAGKTYKDPEQSSDPFADYTPITTEPSFKIIGYAQGGTSLTTWSDAYMAKMTHVVVFGPEVDASGNIVWKNVDKEMLKYWGYWGSKIDTRIMVAFGGNNKSANFSTIAYAGAAQTNFLNQLADLKNYHVYGIDIDREDGWPYPPSGTDQLLSAIAEKIHPLGMKLSVAIGSTTTGLGSTGWNAVDWANVMCYDFNGNSSSCPGSCMSSYSGNKSKAVIGLPFYTGGDGSAYVSGHTNDLVSLSGMATATNSVKNNGYPGVMFWDMSQDKTDASSSLLYKIAATAGYNP